MHNIRLGQNDFRYMLLRKTLQLLFKVTFEEKLLFFKIIFAFKVQNILSSIKWNNHSIFIRYNINRNFIFQLYVCKRPRYQWGVYIIFKGVTVYLLIIQQRLPWHTTGGSLRLGEVCYNALLSTNWQFTPLSEEKCSL